MNGAQHYEEAERLLEEASAAPIVITGVEPSEMTAQRLHEAQERLGTPLIVTGPDTEYHDGRLVAAQVHATLALAAATICAGNHRTQIHDDCTTITDIAHGTEWAEVLS